MKETIKSISQILKKTPVQQKRPKQKIIDLIHDQSLAEKKHIKDDTTLVSLNSDVLDDHRIISKLEEEYNISLEEYHDTIRSLSVVELDDIVFDLAKKEEEESEDPSS